MLLFWNSNCTETFPLCKVYWKAHNSPVQCCLYKMFDNTWKDYNTNTKTLWNKFSKTALIYTLYLKYSEILMLYDQFRLQILVYQTFTMVKTSSIHSVVVLYMLHLRLSEVVPMLDQRLTVGKYNLASIFKKADKIRLFFKGLWVFYYIPWSMVLCHLMVPISKD